MTAITEIGATAEKIWHYLGKNGPSSVAKVTTGTGVGKNDAQRAIGWLAKEGKLVCELKGRVETLSLK
ncbi:winged helix-turn-helix domain-containing protein [Methyloglobulus sp.]|uniref:winged helix-turn-helix domain-containing protein n=1 Tax=Methyloglobulus sp. TaxID=2518622 RepID=UPI0039890998